MGWSSQGYFREYNCDKQDFDDPCWLVDCNGEESPVIEEYYGKKINLNGWEDKVKILYGTSGSLFFKGYVESDDIVIVESILNHFDGFLVYESKYGGQKAFDPKKMMYFIVDNFTLFIENRKYSNDEIDELIEDLDAYILPSHLDISRKEEIKQKVKTTTNNSSCCTTP